MVAPAPSCRRFMMTFLRRSRHRCWIGRPLFARPTIPMVCARSSTPFQCEASSREFNYIPSLSKDVPVTRSSAYSSRIYLHRSRASHVGRLTLLFTTTDGILRPATEAVSPTPPHTLAHQSLIYGILIPKPSDPPDDTSLIAPFD